MPAPPTPQGGVYSSPLFRFRCVINGNKKRTVVITGASAGVGRATVQAFAQEGARIGLIARGKAGLEGAKSDALRLGGEALVLPTDVADA